jgi:hypothetical protein
VPLTGSMRCANEDENKKENKSKKWMLFIDTISGNALDNSTLSRFVYFMAILMSL